MESEWSQLQGDLVNGSQLWATIQRTRTVLLLLVVEGVISDARASRGSLDRCNTNRGCTLTFSRREECFPRLSMSVIYGRAVDLWGETPDSPVSSSFETHVRTEDTAEWRVPQKQRDQGLPRPFFGCAVMVWHQQGEKMSARCKMDLRFSHIRYSSRITLALCESLMKMRMRPAAVNAWAFIFRNPMSRCISTLIYGKKDSTLYFWRQNVCRSCRSNFLFSCKLLEFRIDLFLTKCHSTVLFLIKSIL